jgi:hydrogenase nickel insertion protein HypA
MHETTIARAIAEKVASRCEKMAPSTKASAVTVQVGTFRNVDPESLAFAFECLKNVYPALTECQLNLEIVQARAVCKDHNHEYEAKPENLFRCYICDSGIGKLIKGEELDITSITITEAEETEKMSHA